LNKHRIIENTCQKVKTGSRVPKDAFNIYFAQNKQLHNIVPKDFENIDEMIKSFEKYFNEN